MSASLVGSEMCIRDRPTTENVAGATRRPRAQDNSGASRRIQSEGQQRFPVSYTHLTLPTICSV
eukprot:8635169-Alexandrium_andersonii.AAC.1